MHTVYQWVGERQEDLGFRNPTRYIPPVWHQKIICINDKIYLVYIFLSCLWGMPHQSSWSQEKPYLLEPIKMYSDTFFHKELRWFGFKAQVDLVNWSKCVLSAHFQYFSGILFSARFPTSYVLQLLIFERSFPDSQILPILDNWFVENWELRRKFWE